VVVCIRSVFLWSDLLQKGRLCNWGCYISTDLCCSAHFCLKRGRTPLIIRQKQKGGVYGYWYCGRGAKYVVFIVSVWDAAVFD